MTSQQSRRRTLPDGERTLKLQGKGAVCLRAIYWPDRDASATILIVPGRTEYGERYAETIADLRDKGYAVAIIDMRNHGKSSRPLANREKHHLTDFGLMSDDIHRFVCEIASKKLPRPFYMLAHSMGGHAALRFVHDHPGLVERLLLSAPMIRIHFRPLPDFLVRFLVKLACAAGLAESYALGQGNWKGDAKSRAQLRDYLTSDKERFADEDWQLSLMPDLRLGGVTWGWLDAAIRSADLLESAGFAEEIGTPTRFTLAGADRVVDNAAARRFAARMPKANVVEIEGSRHEPMREADPIRRQFFAALYDWVGQSSD